MASSPIKQGELMAANIPVVCNKGVGDTDWIVSYYETGILIDLSQAEPFKQLQDPRIIFNSEKTKKGAEEYFGLENGIKAYKEVYDAIFKNNPLN